MIGGILEDLMRLMRIVLFYFGFMENRRWRKIIGENLKVEDSWKSSKFIEL